MKSVLTLRRGEVPLKIPRFLPSFLKGREKWEKWWPLYKWEVMPALSGGGVFKDFLLRQDVEVRQELLRRLRRGKEVGAPLASWLATVEDIYRLAPNFPPTYLPLDTGLLKQVRALLQEEDRKVKEEAAVWEALELEAQAADEPLEEEIFLLKVQHYLEEREQA